MPRKEKARCGHGGIRAKCRGEKRQKGEQVTCKAENKNQREVEKGRTKKKKHDETRLKKKKSAAP